MSLLLFATIQIKGSTNDIMNPYIIVLGNEKGGTGKSTLSMHIIVSLLKQGHKVGSVDLDARQGTLSRYIQNRRDHLKREPKKALPLPIHYDLHQSCKDIVSESHAEDEKNFSEIMDILKHEKCDYIVIDTPGNNTYLSRIAHSYAQTLITPINDSYIDLDMLVRVHGDNDRDLRPSLYAQTVWEQKKEKAQRDGGGIDWIVIRNRLSNLCSNNNAEIEKILKSLAPRIGFRLISGFTERVIFKELFLQGGTLLDLIDVGMQMRLSHVAARNELSILIQSIFSSQARYTQKVS